MGAVVAATQTDVQGVDQCRCDIADHDRTDVAVKVVVQHRTVLAHRRP